MSQDEVSSAPGEYARLAPGTLLGDYEVVRVVGSGGMAVVYEGRHRALNKRVALKVLDSDHGGRRVDLARRFLREAENAARLNHEHVVDVSHVGTANGMPYLVMEFLEGEDLGDYLRRVGKLSVEETADLLVPVVCAIGVAHEAGIIHRDLKPQNIFLCRARSGGAAIPKVVDFGVSKLMQAENLSLTATDAIIGTPYYMSPEQAMEAKHVDGRTDQFSLGVILYECVTGQRPFDGDSLFTVLTAIVNLRQEAPSAISYELDPEFEQLIERTLRKKPEERFESARELGRELLRFASLRVQMAHAAELGVQLPIAPRAPKANTKPDNGKIGRADGKTADKREPKGVQASSVAPGPGITGKKKVIVGAGAGVVALVVAGVLLSPRAEPLRPLPPPPPVRQEQPAAAAQPAPQAQPPADDEGSDWDTPGEGASEPARAEPVQAASAQAAAAQSRFVSNVEAQPSNAGVFVDGELVGIGTAAWELPIDGQKHLMRVSATGYDSVEIAFQDRPPPGRITLKRSSAHDQGKTATAADAGVRKSADSEPSKQPQRGANRALIIQ